MLYKKIQTKKKIQKKNKKNTQNIRQQSKKGCCRNWPEFEPATSLELSLSRETCVKYDPSNKIYPLTTGKSRGERRWVSLQCEEEEKER